ncbi:enoyl-CoA hydratase/isomerase family protein [Mycobacterium sp.]|uniref:enoyl-CoA hydratase/isomerase family protein n=1 Tax=Mycobacterium sp. TaxID=1785 RepID=UPI002C9DDD5F|nr:enoyl-CoA hydratase-related protein [Mycobacterium sp.]HTY33442.1 enoyl-CoA hydratase-related protein [Mycobacterium sp.]
MPSADFAEVSFGDAEVPGKAIGLGLHLADMCDFTVADHYAGIAKQFCEREVFVDSGGSDLLPRLVGLRRARQMLLRGAVHDAANAAESVAATTGLATELAAGTTFSLSHTDQLLNHRAAAHLDEAVWWREPVFGGH